jgi:polar amino acid transport system substrate-binding protein
MLACFSRTLAAMILAAALWPPRLLAETGIDAFTEERPPYNFLENDRPAGTTTDVFRALCQEAHIECRIHVVPWARAIYTARTTPDTIVFTTARTPQREDQFLWLGPLALRPSYLYVLAQSTIKAQKFADLHNVRIGVVNRDWTYEEMLRLGVRETDIELAPTASLNITKLIGGHVDAIPAVDIEMAWNLRQHGLAQSAVRPLFRVFDGTPLYIAINPATKPETVAALNKAWAKIANSDLQDQLLEKYVTDLDELKRASGETLHPAF